MSLFFSAIRHPSVIKAKEIVATTGGGGGGGVRERGGGALNPICHVRGPQR